MTLMRFFYQKNRLNAVKRIYPIGNGKSDGTGIEIKKANAQKS